MSDTTQSSHISGLDIHADSEEAERGWKLLSDGTVAAAELAPRQLSATEMEQAAARRTTDRPLGPYVWYVVLLLAVVNVFNSMDRMALSVLAPYIKADLHLTDAQIGLLTGFAFAVFYAVCGVPIARWADRGVRRDIIALALGTWSLMTVLTGAAQNFWQLFVMRVGVGAGEAGGLAPALSLLCDYVPLKRRSGIFALHSIGLIAGIMLGLALGGWLGEVIGWRWTFVVLGVPGTLLALVVKLTLREPERGYFDGVKNAEPAPSFRRTVGILWGSPIYRLLMLVSVTNGFTQYGLNQWWPSFYSRVFGISTAYVGVYLGIALAVGSGVGVLIGGFLSDKFARRDVRLPLLIGAAAVLVAFPVSLASVIVESASVSLILVAFTGLLWSVLTSPLAVAVYSMALPAMRATAGAVMIFFTSVLGLGLGPFCVGVVSDLLTTMFGSEALRYALLVPISLFPVTIVGTYRAAMALPRELDRLANS
jgi:predicted MFS family arabinose efflux permease